MPEAAPGPGTARRHVAALATLLPAIVVLHARELAGGRPYFRDLHQLLLPVRHYAAQALKSGEFPAWWPYDGAGSPLAAQPLFELFHPVQLLYLVLPFWNALALENLLASLAIAAGTYALVVALGAPRRAAVVAAGLFVTSGVVVSMTEFGFQRLATAAMPWYAWALLRGARANVRVPVAAPFVLASAFVVEPQFAAFAVFFGTLVTVLSAGERRAAWRVSVLAPVLGALVAAVQLVPAALLAPHTARAGSLAEAERWVVGARTLAAMVLPFDRGRDQLYVSVFAGPALVLLAGASVAAFRRSRLVPALWGFVLVALWAGAGSAGGLGAVLRMLPVWSSFRYPEKWLVPALLALCVLAGEGLAALFAREKRAFQAGGAALVLAAMAALAVGARPSFADVAVLSGIVLGTGALAFVPARPGLVLAAALGGAPLVWTLPSLRWTDDAFYAPGPMVELLKKENVSLTGAAFERSNAMQADPEQWAAMRAAGAGGGGTAFNGFFGLPTLAPALPGASRRLTALYVHSEEMSSRLDGVFGVGVMVLAPEQIVPRLESQVLGREDRFGWTAIRLRKFLPRAYATAKARFAPSAGAAEEAVIAPEFRPGREVIVEGAWDEAWNRPEALAVPVSITGRTNASVTMSAELPWDGFVVLNEAWFPGWRAEVDGQPAPVLVANAAMRAVPVGRGSHRIVMSYAVPGLAVGAGISLVTALGLVVVGWRRRRVRG